MLEEKFLQFMMENTPQCHNKDYKTYKLKDKLSKEFGSKLQFWQPNYKNKLVYKSFLAKGQEVESAFKIKSAASESRRLEEAALVICRLIQTAQQESLPLPWPPEASFLLSGLISVSPAL